jgi:hypothetical protein
MPIRSDEEPSLFSVLFPAWLRTEVLRLVN